MKVKFIKQPYWPADLYGSELEALINDFIQDKKVIDIKYQSHNQSALIMYEDKKETADKPVVEKLKEEKVDLVVFDPPHLIYAGPNSWLAKKYGKLDKENWPEDLKRGFDECRRVLKPTGTLMFKWNEDQIKFRDVIKSIGQRPIFGDQRSKTRWSIFLKGE